MCLLAIVIFAPSYLDAEELKDKRDKTPYLKSGQPLKGGQSLKEGLSLKEGQPLKEGQSLKGEGPLKKEPTIIYPSDTQPLKEGPLLGEGQSLKNMVPVKKDKMPVLQESAPPIRLDTEIIKESSLIKEGPPLKDTRVINKIDPFTAHLIEEQYGNAVVEDVQELDNGEVIIRLNRAEGQYVRSFDIKIKKDKTGKTIAFTEETVHTTGPDIYSGTDGALRISLTKMVKGLIETSGERLTEYLTGLEQAYGLNLKQVKQKVKDIKDKKVMTAVQDNEFLIRTYLSNEGKGILEVPDLSDQATRTTLDILHSLRKKLWVEEADGDINLLFEDGATSLIINEIYIPQLSANSIGMDLAIRVKEVIGPKRFYNAYFNGRHLGQLKKALNRVIPELNRRYADRPPLSLVKEVLLEPTK